MTFTHVTITHTFETAADTPAIGHLDFVPVEPSHSGPVTIVARPVVAPLIDGALSVALAVGIYRVVEWLTGLGGVSYYVEVPNDQGDTLDLRELSTWGEAPGAGVGGPPPSAGGIVTVNGELPDEVGNLALSAADVGAQPADPDLTTIAALAPVSGSYLGRQSAGWVGRTPAQVKTDLTLSKADVGLASVDDTSDADKPISVLTAAELDARQPLDTDLTTIAGLGSAQSGVLASDGAGWIRKGYAALKAALGLSKSDVGLANVDDTADVDKPLSGAVQDALGALTKSDVGLPDVDNTSDLAKPIGTATQAALTTKARIPDVQTFTASGTWTKPAGATVVSAVVIGGGAGGGSGARRASGTASSGGAGGSAAGYSIGTFAASLLAGTENVGVGNGGSGGAAVAVNDTNGTTGGNGGFSQFGSTTRTVRANGGTGGQGGQSGAVAAPGGGARGSVSGTSGGGGVNGAAGAVAGNGAGATGGGGGGGISATPTAAAGAAAGAALMVNDAFGAAGAVDVGGGAGASVTTNQGSTGAGGGGGGASATTAGGAGGAAGNYGAGGGGGGSSLNGSASGRGGDGAPGIVVVTTW